MRRCATAASLTKLRSASHLRVSMISSRRSGQLALSERWHERRGRRMGFLSRNHPAAEKQLEAQAAARLTCRAEDDRWSLCRRVESALDQFATLRTYAACLSAGAASKPTRGKRRFTLPTEGSSCRMTISSGVQARMIPYTGLP